MEYIGASPLTGKKIKSTNNSANRYHLLHCSCLPSNDQVAAFNEVLLNIFRNIVPNKYMTIDDKDPLWMNDFVKSKIKANNLLF